MPDDDAVGYDVHQVVDALVDADSFFEVKPLFAAELVVGFALLEGQPIGVVANNPGVKGGVLFTDSAETLLELERDEDAGYSFVIKQPTNEEEEEQCREALEECPVEAIGDDIWIGGACHSVITGQIST